MMNYNSGKGTRGLKCLCSRGKY